LSTQIPAQHFTNELLINLLVNDKQWFQLHILLQYRVIADSKPLACLLLSLAGSYPPAKQLALDMLRRLGDSAEEICEVLLADGSVVPALACAASNHLDHVAPSKFLEAALQQRLPDEEAPGDAFAAVYEHFQRRRALPKRGYEEYASSYRQWRARCDQSQ
jgi:hypothetical protein